MGDTAKGWEGEMVCAWLERRIAAARVDQIAADRKGYSAHDDYDKAAAEEWACRAVQAAARKGDQATVAARLKDLLGQDDYPATGAHDDRRFERHIRAYLRKLAKMTKANAGFDNALHYQ
jgi:hypothetical protein